MEQKTSEMTAFKMFLLALRGKAEEAATEKSSFPIAYKVGTIIYSIFVHNMALKAVALVFAVLLWSYIVTETDPIVRNTYQNIPISFEGMDELQSYGMTLIEDISDLRNTMCSMVVDVNFHSGKSLNKDDMVIRCDLSKITGTGEKRLYLRGETPNGTVVKIQPEYIDVNVDEYISKTVEVSFSPVENLPDDKHIAEGAALVNSNPKISGPKEYIDKVSRAYVNIDYANIKEDTFPRSMPFVLLDQNDNIITVPNMQSSENSLVVSMTVQSKKTVTIDITDNFINADQIAEGFYLNDEIDKKPKEVTLYGPQKVLESIDHVSLKDDIDLKNKKESISGRFALQIPDGLTASDDYVHLSIDIIEKTFSIDFKDLSITQTGSNRGIMDITNADLTIYVSYSDYISYGSYQIKEMLKDNIFLYIDTDKSSASLNNKADYTIEYDMDDHNIPFKIVDYLIVPQKVTVTFS